MTAESRRVPPSDPDDFQLVDVVQLKNWARFVLHSLGRRKGVVALTFLLTVGATVALLAILPRTYHIDAQLLTQRNTVMPALGNPGRTVPTDANVPTRAAAETVLRRDNLLSLMKQTDLLNRWEQKRTPVLQLKDWLVQQIAPPSEEDRINAMVGLLEKRFNVTTGESTVNIGIDWPDAQMGYALVDNALQNFLEQRHSAEVSSIAETIAILESHAADLREQIDSTLEDIKRGQAPVSKTVKVDPAAPPPPRRDPAVEAAKAQAAEVKVMIEAKRRAINELDDFRRRRLAELQTELAQKRSVYADAHPAVAQILQSISALQEDSPQLAALRKDERELQSEYERLSAKRAEGTPGVPRSSEVAPRRKAADPPGPDVEGEYSRTRLRFAMEKYDVLLDRINSARIELDTARAAFKYRYSIVRPPQLPKRAEKPKVPLVLAAGVMAAIAFSIVAAALADLRSGRVLESWQVERGLGLEVLGQVPRP